MCLLSAISDTRPPPGGGKSLPLRTSGRGYSLLAHQSAAHSEGGPDVGALIYGSPAMEIQFDDRVLAHVQIVMSAKLRRGENFFFSWRDSPAVGDGRSAIWIDPSIPMYFRYSGSRHPAIDRAWLEQMAIAAAS